MKRSLWILVMLMLAPSAGMAQDWWDESSSEYSPITLELNAWMSKLDGSVTWGTPTVAGSEISFKEGAGIDSDTWGPYVRLNIGLSDRWSLRFSFWHVRQTGDIKLPKAISFGGVTFAQGSQTETTYSLDAYNALLGYKFVDGEQLDFTILFGGAVFSSRMDMESGTTTRAEQTAVVPSPQIGVGIDLTLAKGFVFRSQIVGFALDTSGANGEQFDAEGALNLTLFQGLYLTAGYKFFRVNADFDRGNNNNSVLANNADFEIQGPFFGLGLNF